MRVLDSPAQLDWRPARRRAGAALRTRLLAAARPSILELAAVAAGLLALGGAVFGSHVLNGGFHYDDWANAARTQYSSDSGFPGAIESFFDLTGYRPVLALYVPTVHEVLGGHMGWHLGWALLLAVAMSAAFYMLLTTLGLERLHAAAIAALVLIFPFSDATRLWATSSTAHLAIAIFLAGLILALRGLRSDDRRTALLHHAGAAALYLVSVLLYELTAPAVLSAVVLYLLYSSSWRRAITRFAVDAALIVPAVLIIASDTQIPKAGSIGDQLDHARVMADQALSILTSTALPFGTPREITVLGLLAAVAASALLVWRLLPSADPARRELRRWLIVAAGGLVGAAVGYAAFVPADPYYSPLTPGVGNRVNAFAALGLVTFVYAIAVLAGTLVFRGLPNWRGWAGALAVAAAVVIGAGYVDRIDADKARWDRAFGQEQAVLGVLKRGLPEPREGSTIYTFGHPAYQAPGVPIFASSWDLNGAVKILYDDGSLSGYPAIANTQFVCGDDSLHPVNNGYDRSFGADYGKAYFADAATGRIALIGDRSTCRSARRDFQPGPFEAGS